MSARDQLEQAIQADMRPYTNAIDAVLANLPEALAALMEIHGRRKFLMAVNKLETETEKRGHRWLTAPHPMT